MSVNGDGYMIKWVVGLVGGMLLLGLTSFVNNVMSRLHELELKISELSVVDAIAKESLRQLEELARFARVDQVERAVKFNDIGGKLAVLDSKLTMLDGKVGVVTTNLTTVTTRLHNYFGAGSSFSKGNIQDDMPY